MVTEVRRAHQDLCAQTARLHKHLNQLPLADNLYLVSSILTDLFQLERKKRSLLRDLKQALSQKLLNELAREAGERPKSETPPCGD